MSNAIPMPHTQGEVARALDIARHMAMSGIPIFAAPPCLGPQCSVEVFEEGRATTCARKTRGSGVSVGYHLPGKWEETRADPRAVDAWQPGWALGAVGGYSADFIDVDPRNGGRESAERLIADGTYPRTYGRQLSPSGGYHEVIQPLRTGKGTPLPGIDVQGGRTDGTGHGFVFLAPTVRASKVDGIARPYRWTIEPDLPRLLQWTGETSGAALAGLVKQPKAAAPVVTDPSDASSFFQEARRFTRDQAWAYVRPHLERLAATTEGGRNNQLNITAKVLTHFGPEFWPPDQADYWLERALDPAYPRDEAEATIASARRSAARDWKAELAADRSPLAGRSVEATGEGFGAGLIDAADLDEIEDPRALVDGWLFEGTTARMVGQPGAYKSFVSLDLALCVALGRDWHGTQVQQSPVLYVVGEGLAGYKKRVAAWLEHNGVTRDELRGKLLLTDRSVQIGGDDWPGLTEWVHEQKCRLVVVDTVARATVGLDENSSKEQGVVVEHCRTLCDQTGATMLLVHHTGHANGEAAERGRGSSSWRAAVDTEFILTKTGDYTAALRCDRQKDAESGQTVAVHLVKVAGSLAVRIDHSAPQPVEEKKGRAADAGNDERVYEAVKHLLAKGDVPTRANIVAAARMKVQRVGESLDRLSLSGGKLIRMDAPTGRGFAYQVNPDYSDTLGGLSPFSSKVPDGGGV